MDIRAQVQADPTDALSPAPPTSVRSTRPSVGRVRFFYGPMDCGKSTLALQIDHNLTRQGQIGLRLVRHDRSGQPQISSRIGVSQPALEIADTTDLCALVRERWMHGHRVDYLIIDEAQFLTSTQVEQISELADDSELEVYCFGIATDFRSELFVGSRRLVELADELHPIQVEVLCWCGIPGRFNARVDGDRIVRAGDTVLIADTEDVTLRINTAASENNQSTTVRYQVLCRKHFRTGDLGPNAIKADQLSLG